MISVERALNEAFVSSVTEVFNIFVLNMISVQTGMPVSITEEAAVSHMKNGLTRAIKARGKALEIAREIVRELNAD